MKEFSFKDNTVHPDKEEILKYVWHELDEEREIAIGEHLADCEVCVKEAQEESEFQFLWETWQAHTHGEIHWQKYIKKIIERSYKNNQPVFIKERLQHWITRWKSKLGSMIQFLDNGSKELVEIVTSFPGGIFAPTGNFQFAQATPVRGAFAASNIIKIEAEANIQVQLFVNESSWNVLVKIPKDFSDPPLIILAPGKGTPLIAYPEEVEGTAYYTAAFANIPANNWLLLFEPANKD